MYFNFKMSKTYMNSLYHTIQYFPRALIVQEFPIANNVF